MYLSLPPLNEAWLTAEGNDAHGMEFVLWSDVGPHADDEDIAEACGGGDDPNEDPQHDVGQQVLEGRDAVRVGFAAAHVGSVAAVLELLEVAVKADQRRLSSYMNIKNTRESIYLQLQGFCFVLFYHQTCILTALWSAGFKLLYK